MQHYKYFWINFKLKDFKIDEKLIKEVEAVVESTRDDIVTVKLSLYERLGG